MVRIRLTRVGAKNSPSYRIVAIDSRKPRDSKALEILGFYNPSHNPALFEIKKERLEHWKSTGAQISTAVEELVNGKYTYKKYDPKGEKKEQEALEKSESEVKPADEVPEEANSETAIPEN